MLFGGSHRGAADDVALASVPGAARDAKQPGHRERLVHSGPAIPAGDRFALVEESNRDRLARHRAFASDVPRIRDGPDASGRPAARRIDQPMPLSIPSGVGNRIQVHAEYPTYHCSFTYH